MTPSDSREGIILSEDDIARIGRLIAPLIQKRQSIDHILMNHQDSLPVSAKTLYSYIYQGLFIE